MKPVPSQIFNAIVPAPFGALGIRTAGDQLREVVYLPPSFDEKAADSAIAERSAQQLARYLL
ncbi:cysteine methyltransferase, partial [Acinetobacter baumannii]|nr:cysteine methyltransferase [Acinetobacter baumannii]